MDIVSLLTRTISLGTWWSFLCKRLGNIAQLIRICAVNQETGEAKRLIPNDDTMELGRPPFQEARELSHTLLLLRTFSGKLTTYGRSLRQATSIFPFRDSTCGKTSRHAWQAGLRSKDQDLQIIAP
jgi:hypothetical protein